MTEHGLNCRPFRHLLCSYLNIKLYSYRKVAFQTLKNVEILNPNGVQCEMMWLKEANMQPVGIALDLDFIGFVNAQKALVSKYKSDLDVQLNSMPKIDFGKKENMAKFVSYFPMGFQRAVTEWAEVYMIASKDLTLMQLLHTRMWLDGCHLTFSDLQTIVLLFTLLKEIHFCDMSYLLLLASSAEQSKLVDVFLYARIEYRMGQRFDGSSKIFSLLQTVTNNRLKGLFAVKLAEYKLALEEEDLYKILLMLQNASNGSEQLEKIGLDEWLLIARKQKWSEIGYLLQTYGSIGYYLGLLDNKGFKEEEAKMRQVIDKAKIVPEKLIALYTQWLVTREMSGDEEFFASLSKKFELANNYPKLDESTKYQLVTDELEQAKLLSFMDTSIYKLASTKDRKLDEIVDKISGLHDHSQEEVNKRKESIHKIANLLKANDVEKNKNIYWLNKFDEALCKLKQGRKLRDTQKMAILCAVESDKHVLEQVNTGEGNFRKVFLHKNTYNTKMSKN